MPPETQALSSGQPAPASASTPSDTGAAPRLAPGSVIPVQLTRSVDAKKAKTGDEVVARVTQDLRNQAGTVVVGKDTKVVGHITEAQPRTKEEKASQLTIAFDQLVPKSGEPMQLPMSIQAIIAPQNPSASASGSQPSDPPPASPNGGISGASTAAGARAGAVGGAPTTPTAGAAPASDSAPAGAPTGASAQPRITGNTQGVVGIANLNLAPASDTTQGSVVSSEKNNVKLDDGTFLLLRVNQ